MSLPSLTVSNYSSILEDMGVRWGVRSKSRPNLFSFSETLTKNYSGVRIRSTLQDGMEAFWILDSSLSASDSIHLVTCDRSFLDWSRRTNFGTALFVKGRIYDPSYGTSTSHPHSFISTTNKIVGLDDFMAQASLELQDFVIKNILFNLE